MNLNDVGKFSGPVDYMISLVKILRKILRAMMSKTRGSIGLSFLPVQF